MALSDAEIAWIEYITGDNIELSPEDAAAQALLEQEQAAQREADRQKFLTEHLNAHLSDVEGDLDTAMSDLSIENPEDPGIMKSIWLAVTGGEAGTTEMKWRATDADLAEAGAGKWAMRMDIEVDTSEDIRYETTEIPPEKLKPLGDAYAQLLKIQEQMENQLDEKGERLFSDEDIRKELWSPMLREGLIPENMIPDAYSEQAIAFKGAQELYSEKIVAYSETHSKKVENFKLGMRIAKEFTTMAGAIVGNAVTISNATSVADKQGEITELKKQDADLKAELDGPPPPTAERAAEIEAQREVIKTDTQDLTAAITEMQNETVYVQNGTAILLGGLGAAELVVDHQTSQEKDNLKKWCNTIEKGLALTQTVAGKTVDSAMRGQGASSGMVTCVTAGMNAAFSGVRAVPTLILAVQEANDDKRARLIDKLIGNLASAVQNSFNSVAGKLNSEASSEADADVKRALLDQEAALKQIGAGLGLAISQVGKGPAILRAIKNGNTKELAMLLGGAAVAAAFGASSEAIFDVVRDDAEARDVLDMSRGESTFHEATGSAQEAGQDSGSAASMDEINAALDSVSAMALDGLRSTTRDPLEGTSAADLAAEVEAATEQAIEDQAKQDLEEAFSPDAIAQILLEADAELEGYEQMYSDAYPDSEMSTRTPEEILQAQTAIDRAMANTAQLRQKVALINGLTASGASVLAALVPGAGAVVAAQKVVKDIYALKKAVDTHNAWVSSMELSFAAQSGASAAIQNTLQNAKIHLDHSKISLALHSAQAGAAVAQVLDPSGVATIVSASLSMADAVTEFAYKMHAENEIRKGWNAYKDALENPGSRKRARKALRLNSTLAKCCIAYGATIIGDPSAQQAIRATGLTVAALQNDSDICVKLIAYLENELADDPTVLKVVNTKDTSWHPGKPQLTLASWCAFKGAALRSAEPLLAQNSAQTPAIDRLLSELEKLDGWQTPKAIEAAKADYQAAVDADPTTEFPPNFEALLTANRDALSLLERAQAAFSAYVPQAQTAGTTTHSGMMAIAGTCVTLTKLGITSAEANIDTLQDYVASYAD